MSTVGATNCAARMDMDFTDYGLRSIMDHDLDYDNNVFPPSPPQPQDSAGRPQDYAGSSPLPTGRPRSSSTPMLQPGNYKSYGAAYKLVPNFCAPMQFRIVLAPVRFRIVRAPMPLQIVRALTVSVLKNSSRPRIVRALE